MTIDTSKLAEMAADSNTMMEILNEIERAGEETVLPERQREVYVLRNYGFRNSDIAELIDSLGSDAAAAAAMSNARTKIEKAENTVEFKDKMEEKEFGRVRA